MALNMKAPAAGRTTTVCRSQRTVSVPSCSLIEKIQDVTKKTVATLAATTILTGVASAGLTYDQFQSLTYKQVKGTGLANTCPIIDGGSDNPKDLKSGNYNLTSFCMEPTAITVKEDEEGKFERTKLMTRLTYTLDAMDGKFNVSGGNVSLTEEEGLDFAPVTVQLDGGERVPYLFTVKELNASGPVDGSIKGSFLVPSYRGSTFLDPKGRGGSTGYDVAVGLYAAQEAEEFTTSNLKRTDSSTGKAVFSIAKVDPVTGEVAGVFETVQPSDTDLGGKAPKEVKTVGIWYGRL